MSTNGNVWSLFAMCLVTSSPRFPTRASNSLMLHLPPSLCAVLARHGHDANHTLDLPAKNATKDCILNQISFDEQRVVISKDVLSRRRRSTRARVRSRLGACVGNGERGPWRAPSACRGGEGRQAPVGSRFGRALAGRGGRRRRSCERPWCPHPVGMRARPPLRCSLRRLWIAQWKRHWARAAGLPRSRSWRASWTVVIWPKTGSTIVFRRA